MVEGAGKSGPLFCRYREERQAFATRAYGVTAVSTLGELLLESGSPGLAALTLTLFVFVQSWPIIRCSFRWRSRYHSKW